MKRFWLTLAVALSVASPSLAHAPGKLDANAAFVVSNPKISLALFGLFVTGAERFVIRLSFDERFATTAEMLVPHQAPLRDHRPAFAVVGPGLPPPNAAELAALPEPLPAGFGAIVELNDQSPRVALFESIMRRVYWTSGALAVVFPKGDLEIWVWSPAGTKGKFCLGYGIEEGGGYMAAFEDWSFYEY